MSKDKFEKLWEQSVDKAELFSKAYDKMGREMNLTSLEYTMAIMVSYDACLKSFPKEIKLVRSILKGANNGEQ